MFELSGYDKSLTARESRRHFDKRSRRDKERIQRWKTFAAMSNKRSKALHIQDAGPKDGVVKILDNFKQIFKFIVVHCCDDKDQELFM